MTNNTHVLALDVGEKRIGVAIASYLARLPQALVTLQRDADSFKQITQLVHEHEVSEVVIGLPRGLNGQETAQTKATQAFANGLKQHIAVPVYFQDEAVTSVRAREELEQRKVPYNKQDVDALAAVYILEDYLSIHRKAA